MATPEIQFTTVASPPAAAQAAIVHSHGFTFHQFLSAINPLQYLPVVGTIYRALTGDVIPEALREGGSMLVSGLLGGPIGIITSIFTTLAEKATGIDPEKIAARELGPAHASSPAANPTPASPPIEQAASTPAQPTPSPAALTADQLSAYGVRPNTSGTPKPNTTDDADTLNGKELVRLSEVAAAYAATQARSPSLKAG
ncbi:MAG TPA: hypothetical protein VGM42_04740 [Rhodopila sp.]